MRLLVLVFVAAGALTGACGGKSPTSPATTTPTTPTPTPTPTPTGLPISPYVWSTEGVRLDSTSLSFTGAFADSTTIRLVDGRYRMYLYANRRYRSAISPDGLTFTIETSLRLDGNEFPEDYGQMRVIRMADGRIRSFNLSGENIVSTVSSDDGVTFTREPGVRLSGSAIGFRPTGISIVRLSNGLYRMYFSRLQANDGTFPVLPLRSASSIDMLTWTLDDGVRIGPGAKLEGSAGHPGAIANTDGSVSVFYMRNTPGPDALKMVMSTSRDGLTFTEEFDTGLRQANDPDVVALPDGRVRMYYNWGDDNGGRISSALYSGQGFKAGALTWLVNNILVPDGAGRSLLARPGSRPHEPK